MAKRFTSTNKWSDPWYRKLPPDMKLFWQYITDNCDMAGIWSVDMELASFLTGNQYEEKEILKAFDGRIVSIKNGQYWHIPQFVEFQYGQLKDDYNPHKPAIASLIRHGINPRVHEPLNKASRSLMGKGKDKDNIYILRAFDEFWAGYPRKINKAGALACYRKLKVDENLHASILDGVKRWKETEQWNKDDGKYIPHPATWLNQRRWEDEITKGDKKNDPYAWAR